MDESKLDFSPDPEVSADDRERTGLKAHPTETHRANLQARIDAVVKARNKVQPRGSPDFVPKLILACVRLAPPSDD